MIKNDAGQWVRMYSERELEIAYCTGLLNRTLTIDELSKELERARNKIDLLKQAIERGDFELVK